MIRPYKDVVLFVVCLFVAHFFWKYTIDADEHGGPVFWFGMNISAPFDFMSMLICKSVEWLVGLTRDSLHYIKPDYLRFNNGNGEKIVWSCTALKQLFIWLIIMLFAKGSWLRKLWYIPLGAFLLSVFNILRIYWITLVVEQHPEMFDVLHNYVFKYLFYLVMFMLWVLWTERLGATQNKN